MCSQTIRTSRPRSASTAATATASCGLPSGHWVDVFPFPHRPSDLKVVSIPTASTGWRSLLRNSSAEMQHKVVAHEGTCRGNNPARGRPSRVQLVRTALRSAAVSIVLVAMLASAEDSRPTVAVTGGRIRGAILKDGVAVFKGIPFAQPPVGDLRWREPAPVKPWTGVRDAIAFGAPCAQNSGGRMLENSSEDCLFLNLWTPEWPVTSHRPVMLWIHGGGNYAGTSSSANFDGSSLTRHGIVLVTANYRLTVFGFFAHPDLTSESPHHASGNYGLMDQIAALKWIHDNIATFGGDPGNVTVFRQSAGAADASVLM